MSRFVTGLKTEDVFKADKQLFEDLENSLSNQSQGYFLFSNDLKRKHFKLQTVISYQKR